MAEVVVLSGKGGTGKTSLVASLAFLAGNNAVIADCDVDAANLHLLLQPDFAGKFDFFGGELASINDELCIQCGKCADVCRFNAITFSGERYSVSHLDCEGCGYCEKICPTQAISMTDRLSGRLYISETRIKSRLVHARMEPGAENSGKMVARIKNEANEIAVSDHIPLVIVDGSPGIGCPVISSLSGANYVILVTEPSISGLSDLKRVFLLIQKFRIKTGCIINKFDLNPEVSTEIRDYLKEMGIDHLADIPYDAGFTKAMIEGKTIVETDSSLKTIILSVWELLKTEFNLKSE